MGYHTHVLLETTEDASGLPVSVVRREHLLISVSIADSAVCEIQARQLGGQWKTLETFIESGELNSENFGWHEVRATASDVTGDVLVSMSWR